MKRLVVLLTYPTEYIKTQLQLDEKVSSSNERNWKGTGKEQGKELERNRERNWKGTGKGIGKELERNWKGTGKGTGKEQKRKRTREE